MFNNAKIQSLMRIVLRYEILNSNTRYSQILRQMNSNLMTIKEFMKMLL